MGRSAARYQPDAAPLPIRRRANIVPLRSDQEENQMAAIRRATVSWTGDLASGSGRVDATTSGAFKALPVTWASRTGEADGRTSPEELLASAHASCFSMAFSSELTKAGFKPESLDVTAEIAFDQVDGKWTVISSKLSVNGSSRRLLISRHEQERSAEQGRANQRVGFRRRLGRHPGRPASAPARPIPNRAGPIPRRGRILFSRSDWCVGF